MKDTEIVLSLTKKYSSLLKNYGLTTPLRLAHFWAQISHESGLKPISENLNYSADRLLEIFKSDFDTNKDRVLSETEKKLAKFLERKPKDIANFVYANQNGNGDVNSGDGWNYRGRGFIQITGRANYLLLSKDTRIDYIKNPDLLLNEPDALISALWYWNKIKGNTLADKDDVKSITKAINGGYNGFDDRKNLLIKYKKLFNI